MCVTGTGLQYSTGTLYSEPFFCHVCELAVFTLSLPHQRKLKALKAIFVCGVCGAQCAFA